MKVGITGVFGVSRENDNGRRMIDFCAESGACVDKYASSTVFA